MITDFKREAEKSYTPSRMGGVHVHQSLRKNLTATKTLAQVQRCDSEPTLLAWLMPSPILTPEAQKPKTFRIAAFYAQKYSGRSA